MNTKREMIAYFGAGVMKRRGFLAVFPAGITFKLLKKNRAQGLDICFVCDKKIARRVSELKVGGKNYTSSAMRIVLDPPKPPEDTAYTKRQFGKYYPPRGRKLVAAVCWECFLDMLRNSNKWGGFI